MGNHDWDDDQIEQLLSNAPKIRDERSKEEILARLKNDPRLQAPEEKKKWNKWVPASISAAAVVTLAILVSSFYNGNQNEVGQSDMDQSAKQGLHVEIRSANEEADQPDTKEAEMKEEESFALSMDINHSRLAVYPSDLDAGYTAFHLGVSSQAEPIPVTFLISNEKIAEDFGDIDPSSLTSVELYKKYAGEINETAYGFSNYHPMAGTFKRENDLIINVLPKGYTFDQGSASQSMVDKILQLTFYGYNQLKIVNPDGSPVEFGEMGLLEPIQLTNGYFGKPYYSYTLEDGQTILAPWFHTEPKDLEDAFNTMKESQNDSYKTVIPDDINFTISEEKGLVHVKFSKPLDLLSMNPEEADRMIEGMLLTAASFQTQIQFENIEPEEWNGFTFTKPIPMPIGPNPFFFKQ